MNDKNWQEFKKQHPTIAQAKGFMDNFRTTYIRGALVIQARKKRPLSDNEKNIILNNKDFWHKPSYFLNLLEDRSYKQIQKYLYKAKNNKL